MKTTITWIIIGLGCLSVGYFVFAPYLFPQWLNPEPVEHQSSFNTPPPADEQERKKACEDVLFILQHDWLHNHDSRYLWPGWEEPCKEVGVDFSLTYRQ